MFTFFRGRMDRLLRDRRKFAGATVKPASEFWEEQDGENIRVHNMDETQLLNTGSFSLLAESRRSRLFRISDTVVYKQFLPGELSDRYRENLLCWKSHRDVAGMPEVVAPVSLVWKEGQISGYLMPFCGGVVLEEFLADPQLPYRTKLQAMLSIADFLSRLPDDAAVGDLHEENIIVSADSSRGCVSIRIVDCESFTFADGPQLNCPIKPLLRQPEMRPLKKYYDAGGKLYISKQTDILCYFRMLVRWLSERTWEPAFAGRAEWFDHIAGLSLAGFPPACISQLYRLWGEEKNELCPQALRELIRWSPASVHRTTE